MSNQIAWLLLVVSGLLDVAWVMSVKYAQGYTRPGWSLVSLLLLGSFIYSLGRCLEVLPVGTAYAVWTGIGAVGTAIIGVFLFGEALTAWRIGSIFLVILGIAGLKLAG